MTNSYELSYENPGAYTNMPAILKYDEAGATLSVSYNILPAKLRNPSGFGLVSENYLGTFDLIDMLTGNGDFFQLIPLAFIVLIAAVEVFKMYRKRSTSEPQAQDETSLPEPPIDEDTPEDLP